MRKFLLLMVILPLAAMAQKAGLERAQELFEAEKWRAAHYELQRLPQGELRDVMLAHCAANLGNWGEAQMRTQAFEKEYPASAFMPEMRLIAGFCYFDESKWAQALACFESAGDPPKERRDEYFFKRGYSEFALGKDAIMTLSKVNDGEYLPHARYFLAYINYTAGRLADAKLEFRTLQDHPLYKPLIPYYLLQIEFQEGNFDYVIETGPQLLGHAEGQRKADIERVLSEAYFHKQDFDKALDMMGRYRADGGELSREEMYMEGYAEYTRGNHEKAIGLFSQVVGADDRLTQNAAYHMAAAAMAMGDHRAAMQSFSIAAASNYDPKVQEDARFNNGKLQFEAGGGMFNEAINVLQSFLEDYPNSPRADEAAEYLAAAYYNSHNYDAAYNAIKRVPAAGYTLRAALQKIAYFYALELYSQGDTARARTLLEESLNNDLDPKYGGLAQFWLGEILYQQGSYARAADYLAKFAAAAPAVEGDADYEHVMGMYDLGYAYFNMQNWEAARKSFEKFIETYRPKDKFRADALNRLGDTHYATREFWRAIERYNEAASLGTEQRYYSAFQRAMTLGHVDRGARKIESLTAIMNSIEDPYADDALYEMGTEYISQQLFESAGTAMRSYVDRYPNGEKAPDALVDLGLIYQNLGDDQNAIKYYKQAIAKAPSSPRAKDALFALRNIYVARNSVDEYFSYARQSGMETNIDALQRDSLAYAAVSGNYRDLAAYLERYPRGTYRMEALSRAASVAPNPEIAARYLEELISKQGATPAAANLERLAPLYEATGRKADAAATWRKLNAIAPSEKALRGIIANDSSEAAADNILASSNDPALRQRAQLIKAENLEMRGDRTAAYAAYRAAATDVKTAAGARATLKVIENMYSIGDMDGAQKLIMKFSSEGAAHQQDLARAFLVLGDIYARKGDTFQARATWQSIVDGYSAATPDGIVEEARKRINSL